MLDNFDVFRQFLMKNCYRFNSRKPLEKTSSTHKTSGQLNFQRNNLSFNLLKVNEYISMLTGTKPQSR